jgi:hypothetical protein
MRHNVSLVISIVTLIVVAYLALELQATRSELADVQATASAMAREVDGGRRDLATMLDLVGRPDPPSGGFVGTPAGPRTLFDAANGPDLSGINEELTGIADALGVGGFVDPATDRIDDLRAAVEALDARVHSLCREGSFTTC